VVLSVLGWRKQPDPNRTAPVTISPTTYTTLRDSIAAIAASADHGPKHAPGSISGEGCRTGKQITWSKNKTALRRHIPYAQNRLTGTTPLPKS
jgi:hypothetical protein